LLLVVATVACLFGLGLVLRFRGLQTAANVAQLVSVLLALAALAPPLQAWRRERRRSLVVSPEDLAGAQEHLAMLLRAQWRTESQLRALDDPDPIPVRWRLTKRDELIDIPENRTGDVLTVASSDDLAGLVEDFRRLRRRRLVILGEAGAGKTTLAVQILLELLRTRDQHPGEPVPVLLSFAGWNASSGQALPDWAAARISHDYPELSAAGYGPHVVAALAGQGLILPILDGLDETPTAVQDTAVEALNRALDGDAHLILTSRTEEFSHAVKVANRVLSSAVVVEPEPLTATAAADYLARCLPPVPDPAWRDILDMLRTGAGSGGMGAAFAGIATSPLGLWLLRAGYITPGADPTPLLDGRYATVTALRAHLFDQLIPASVAARPPSGKPTEPFRPRHPYDPAVVDRWLRFLAFNLDRWDTRDFDWTRDVPSLAAPVRWPAASARLWRCGRPKVARLLAGLLACHRWMWLAVLVMASMVIGTVLTVLGVLFHAAATFLGHPRPGNAIPGLLGLSVLLALAAAVAEGAVLLARRSLLNEFDPVEELTADWYAAGRILAAAAETLTFGLAYALATGVVSGVAAGLVTGARTGWWIGLAVGGTAGLITMLRYPGERNRPPGTGRRLPWYGTGPGPGIRSGMAAGVGFGIIGGLLLAGVYLDQVSKNHPVLVSFLVATIAALAGLLAMLRGVLVPAVYSVTSPVLAMVNAALRRPADDRQDSLALWQREGIRQRLRLLRAVFVTILVAAGAAVLWRAMRDSPDIVALRRAGSREWLGSHLRHIDLVWRGHLRYAFAVAIAWLITVPRSGHRTWRMWLVWLAMAATVAVLWPLTGWLDAFRLRLTGRFPNLDAALTLHAHAQLGPYDGTGAVWQAVDLAAVLSDRRMRWIGLGLLSLAGVLAVDALVGRLEIRQPRVWWSVRVSSRWHVARGRMPRDLLVFLDDAHRLGLLRAVGTVYQFRHAELQDHLARSATPPLPAHPDLR
jgi:hypothetical protein